MTDVLEQSEVSVEKRAKFPQLRRREAHTAYLNSYYLRYLDKLLRGKITKEELARKFTVNHLAAERAGERDDLLTKFLDKKTFPKDLDEALAIVQENSLDGALLFIDADRLRDYNNKYGHGAGDQFLKICGKTILDSIRAQEDLAGRTGGDELAVFLPATDLQGAVLVAERIRLGVPQQVVSAIANKDLPEIPWSPTVSIGIAMIRPGISSAELTRQADVAAYHAKASGRNQVVIFEEGMTMPSGQAETDISPPLGAAI